MIKPIESCFCLFRWLQLFPLHWFWWSQHIHLWLAGLGGFPFVSSVHLSLFWWRDSIFVIPVITWFIDLLLLSFQILLLPHGISHIIRLRLVHLILWHYRWHYGCCLTSLRQFSVLGNSSWRLRWEEELLLRLLSQSYSFIDGQVHLSSERWSALRDFCLVLYMAP